MELLYYWATGTNPSTIKEPYGLNFSSEFDFYIEKEGDQFCLKLNMSWVPHPSIFSEGCIENVSALVGENGAGKTTFLHSLVRIAEELHDDTGNGLQDYGIPMFPNKKHGGLGYPFMYVYIFRNDEQIDVYTSLQKLDCSGLRSLNPILYYIGEIPKSKLINDNEFPFKDITVVYFTNSHYSPYFRDISHYKGINSISLTPKTITHLMDKYYEDICDINKALSFRKRYESPSALWNWISYKSKRNLDHQPILDLLYYDQIIGSERTDTWYGKILTPFGLFFENIPHLLKDYITDVDSYDALNSRAMLKLMVTCTEANRYWKKFLPNEELFTRIMYLNLALEVIWNGDQGSNIDEIETNTKKYACHKMSEGMYTFDGEIIRYADKDEKPIRLNDDYKCDYWPFQDGINDKEKIKIWVKDRIRNGFRGDVKLIEYFKKALDEINDFLENTIISRSELIKEYKNIKKNEDVEEVSNSMGEMYFDTFTYMNSSVYFNYGPIDVCESADSTALHKEEYRNITAFLGDCVKNDYSFILKYITLRTLGMSSGERCLNNLFSWLSEVPHMCEHFDSSNKDEYRLKNNLLLLLDEPDLFMHPQWQKCLIKNLTEELKLQFSNKKVQVVFTTSSPITLSDIPLENTMYIRYDRKSDGRRVLAHRQGQDDQTFGADIYRLFSKSFFLQGSPMGKYAEDFINNEILARLVDMLNDTHDSQRKLGLNDSKDRRDVVLKELEDLKWKIKLLGSVPLYRKAWDMYEELREWCNSDSD